MARVHQLIKSYGADQAKSSLAEDQHLVAPAYHVMTDERLDLALLYAGFCLLALPHRKISETQKYVHEWGGQGLEIEPGYLPGRENDKLIGVPYGPKARLVLLYLQTRAMQQDSPEVELGRSMREWMTRMGVSTGGKSYRDLKEQMLRLTASHMTVTWREGHKLGFSRVRLIKNGLLVPETLDDDGIQGRLWADTVTLDDDFFHALKRHAVPIQEAAVSALSRNSAALDIYVWLAYRLRTLESPMTVGWSALHAQFGQSYKTLKNFRIRFSESLKLALAVYEDANVDIHEKGVTLNPSRPPIPSRNR